MSNLSSIIFGILRLALLVVLEPFATCAAADVLPNGLFLQTDNGQLIADNLGRKVSIGRRLSASEATLELLVKDNTNKSPLLKLTVPPNIVDRYPGVVFVLAGKIYEPTSFNVEKNADRVLNVYAFEDLTLEDLKTVKTAGYEDLELMLRKHPGHRMSVTFSDEITQNSTTHVVRCTIKNLAESSIVFELRKDPHLLSGGLSLFQVLVSEKERHLKHVPSPTLQRPSEMIELLPQKEYSFESALSQHFAPISRGRYTLFGAIRINILNDPIQKRVVWEDILCGEFEVKVW